MTDADLILGVLNPENFAGGQIDLDVGAAEHTIATRIAEPLGLSVPEAALEIRNVVDHKLASALRLTSIEDGFDPTEFTMMGFGGAGPMHACHVSELLGSKRIVFPANPGLTAAFGNVTSDIQYNSVRSIAEPMTDADLDTLTTATEQLLTAGADELESSGVPASNREYSVTLDVKYESQNHYLTIAVPQSDTGTPTIQFSAGMLDSVACSFRLIHESRYGFSDDDHPIELGAIRATATGRLTTDPIPREREHGGALDDARRGTRPVFVEPNHQVEAPFYEWQAIPAGSTLDGPGIVEVENATIWIPPAFRGTVDSYKNVIVERREA